MEGHQAGRRRLAAQIKTIRLGAVTMPPSLLLVDALVGWRVTVLRPIDLVPRRPDFAQCRQVKIAHQHSLFLIQFILRRTFEVKDGVCAVIVRRGVMRPDQEYAVFQGSGLKQVNQQRPREIVRAIRVDSRCYTS